MAENTLTVTGMACEHCKMTVENAVTALEGVQAASVDLGAKTVTVTYDAADVSPEQLKTAIGEAGYTVEA